MKTLNDEGKQKVKEIEGFDEELFFKICGISV